MIVSGTIFENTLVTILNLNTMKKLIVIAIIFVAISLTANAEINYRPHFRCRIHPRVYYIAPRVPRVVYAYPVYPVYHYRVIPFRRHIVYRRF